MEKKTYPIKHERNFFISCHCKVVLQGSKFAKNLKFITMKKNLLTFTLLFTIFSGFAQLTIESGVKFIVYSGSTVVVNGDIVSNDATFGNNGTIVLKGDMINNTSVLFSDTSAGTIKFNGTAAQEITGDYDVGFYGVTEIDNSAGVSVTNTATGADQTINGELKFTNGKLTLNDFNLTIGATDPTGTGLAAYVVTNGTGTLKRNVPADGATDVTFPVGNTAYNSLTLKNSVTATADVYGVRVVDNEPANASTDHMVNRSWEVTEGASGGSDLTVTAQWNGTEELTGFSRTNSAIGLTTDGGTTYTWSETGAAAGSDPYTKTNSSFTGVGTFAVGDYYFSGKRLNLKFFLAGAYNTTNSYMDKTLNTSGLIPATDPYGMNTTAPSIPTDAVDWVKVILRDKTTPTTLVDSFAFFVDINGNLLDTLGTQGGKIFGVTLDNYNIEVFHRNHLPVMTSSLVNLNISGTPSYDFTIGLSQAWDDATVTTNEAMKEVETGVWGLWEGDANHDGKIQYEGGNPDRISVLSEVGISTPSNIITSIYSANDVNMDGEVQYEGGNPDRITILSVVGISTPSQIFYVHLPK